MQESESTLLENWHEMFPSPVFDGAKYIGGISKSLANTVWNYFKSKEEVSLKKNNYSVSTL